MKKRNPKTLLSIERERERELTISPRETPNWERAEASLRQR